MCFLKNTYILLENSISINNDDTNSHILSELFLDKRNNISLTNNEPEIHQVVNSGDDQSLLQAPPMGKENCTKKIGM